ncbi:MAG TPA: ATP-binding protein [Anaerolineaceae bacterium]|nr:ATP-binding protein [Anaerolineaceae bacterium]HPN53409.1 ATP-binding protein [Anaerolineaceae bacterium]
MVEQSSERVESPTSTLAEILVSHEDLQIALKQCMSYLQQKLNGQGWFLIVQEPMEVAQLVEMHEGLCEDWLAQVNYPFSLLRNLVRINIDPRGLAVNETSLSPAYVMPMVNEDKQQGLLMICGISPAGEDLKLLAEAARIIGRMTPRIRNYFELIEFNRILDTIGQIIAGFTPGMTMDEVITRLVTGICNGLNCEAGTIALRDEGHEDMVVRKTLVIGSDWIYQVSLSSGEGVLGQCLESGAPLLLNEPEQDPRFSSKVDGIQGLQIYGFLGVPLRIDNQTAGVLALHNKLTGAFSPSDLHLLTLVANLVSNAIQNLKIIHKLRVLNANLEASRWELMRSRNTLRSLFDNIPESIYIIDQNYRLAAVNLTRATRAKGDPREMVGQLCFEVLAGSSEPCPGCLVGETFYQKKVSHRTHREWLDEDKEPVEWDISTYPILDETEDVIQAILFERDVTEKHRLEAFLAQSEKMAALGQLAAGIAHEINNPLTVIIANAQILARDLQSDPDSLESVDLIQRAGERALYVVRNLLNFARKEQYDFVPTDINSTIRRSLEMVAHEAMGRSIEIVFEPGEGLPAVMASADHLQGVWLNIIINGMDSLEGNPGRVRIVTYTQGNEVRVAITDNGKGISPEKIKRIFEPFFTTKEPGKGTGLGLSVCHQIIKQHGGQILVDSAPKKGTTFTVVFPTY